jgi:hypothetical protein
VLKPLNITVMRFAHEGMLVNSVVVPLKVFSVSLVIVPPEIVLFVSVCIASVPTNVVLASGRVILLGVELLGLVIVKTAVAPGCDSILIGICLPHTIVHAEPDGIVTTTPFATVIGPAVRAFLFELIV